MNKQNKHLTKTVKSNTIGVMTGRKHYTSQMTGKTVSRQATHFTVRLGNMKYSTHIGAPVALARGKYEGYPFLILNTGTHPTAYVCLPKGHRYYRKHYRKINDDAFVTAHGGFTYSGKEVMKSTIKDRWWIGWDYAHPLMGDYIAYIAGMPDSIYRGIEPKRWTREEIINEVKEVIDQLDVTK